MKTEIKEAEANIKKEERRIEWLKGKIESLRFDLKATEKALKFWKGELKNAKSHKKCIHDRGTVIGDDGRKWVKCSAFDKCIERSCCNKHCCWCQMSATEEE